MTNRRLTADELASLRHTEDLIDLRERLIEVLGDDSVDLELSLDSVLRHPSGR
jgi:hypothetical protein